MLAHVGSAPVEEVLLVMVPVSALAVALYFANRRADRALRERAGASSGAPTSGETPEGGPVDDA